MATIVFAPGFVFGNTVVIEPGPDIGQDTFASINDPDANYGDLLTMGVDCYRRSFLRFTQLDGYIGYEITSAELEFWYGTSYYSTDAYFCRVLEPWDEDTLTWNNQPDYSTQGPSQHFPAGESKSNYAVDVTFIVQKWLSGEWVSYGWCITDGAWYDYLGICTSNYPGVGNGPKLTITGPNLPPVSVQPTSLGKIKSIYSPQQVSSVKDGRGQFAKHSKREAWATIM